MHQDAPTFPTEKKPNTTKQLSLSPHQGVHLHPQRGPLAWWYRLAAPREPLNATPQDRERVRAGR
ncbi:MAG: hypothetical protein J2P36_34305, partial [Ktedonobacteraceae bacterium]|nr:hypothetical protein [Ktedonobacteraceae bacterium]